MKHVLCFGDSNTWGYIPGTEGERFPFEERYPGILQGRLGAGIRVHEEGLNGRMTGWDDPLCPDRNALKQIAAVLETHRPLDMIVVMLGTNDLKRFMRLEAVDCALALDGLIEAIEGAPCGPSGGRPALLVVSPPHVVETPTPFGRKFDGAIPKSHAFAAAYAEIAAQRKCLFLDAAPVARASARDGIHLDKEAHRQLAEAVAGIVKNALDA
ncbi:MAG: SGNH/GDSL hydrolase family protein [Fibrobacteres bacterium]|jgi:lysophospholipase L1-like esterase|nr:SGNH/GDSL hydrolase family protein [Fibrobacterota bacterium]